MEKTPKISNEMEIDNIRAVGGMHESLENAKKRLEDVLKEMEGCEKKDYTNSRFTKEEELTALENEKNLTQDTIANWERIIKEQEK